MIFLEEAEEDGNDEAKGDGVVNEFLSCFHVVHYTILSTNCKHYLRVFLKFLCA